MLANAGITDRLILISIRPNCGFAEAEILAEDIALIALVCVSYGCGLGNNRHLFSTSMLVVLLVLVITGIMDLDRPRRGLVNVSDKHDSVAIQSAQDVL